MLDSIYNRNKMCRFIDYLNSIGITKDGTKISTRAFRYDRTHFAYVLLTNVASDSQQMIVRKAYPDIGIVSNSRFTEFFIT
jgi:hypothetical protein